MTPTQKLIDTIARLNPDAGEIGAGMLASLVADAKAIQSQPPVPAEEIEWLSDYCRRPAPGEDHLPHLRKLLVQLQPATGAPDAMAECDLPPAGWHCTRVKGHEGPCAAVLMEGVNKQMLAVPWNFLS